MADINALLTTLISEMQKDNKSDSEEKTTKLVQSIVDQNEEVMATMVEGTRRTIKSNQDTQTKLTNISDTLDKDLASLKEIKTQVSERKYSENLNSIERAIKNLSLEIDTRSMDSSLSGIEKVVRNFKFPKEAKDAIPVRISDGEKFIEALTQAADRVVVQSGGGGSRIPTVQVSGGSEAVPVVNLDGTSIGAPTSSTSVLTNVSGSASTVVLKAANTSRKKIVIFNDSTSNLYIKYGTTASLTSFSYKLSPYDTLEEQVYVGKIDGIWESATGAARVTELT